MALSSAPWVPRYSTMTHTVIAHWSRWPPGAQWTVQDTPQSIILARAISEHVLNQG